MERKRKRSSIWKRSSWVLKSFSSHALFWCFPISQSSMFILCVQWWCNASRHVPQFIIYFAPCGCWSTVDDLNNEKFVKNIHDLHPFKCIPIKRIHLLIAHLNIELRWHKVKLLIVVITVKHHRLRCEGRFFYGRVGVGAIYLILWHYVAHFQCNIKCQKSEKLIHTP